MSRYTTNESGAKPWSPSGPTEATLDGLTLGLTRRLRAQRINAHYAQLDDYRLPGISELGKEAAPRLLPDLEPDARVEKMAQLALKVAQRAETVHIETFQGYTATSRRAADGTRRASAHFSGNLHEPTLFRVKEATGRDYKQDLRSAHALVTLISRSSTTANAVDIEGIGCVANEYWGPYSMTDRITDATFLIQGLPLPTAKPFVNALRKQPAEMLDGIAYTAFADTELPGKSLLQASSAAQQAASLIVPGMCSEVIIARG